MSLYESISGIDLEKARTARFTKDFFEYGGPPDGQHWRIRHWLPLDFQAYCALVMPWKAYLQRSSGWVPVRHEPFEDIEEAYEFVGLPVPDPIDLETWHSDFRMVEAAKMLPPLVRVALNRFSQRSDTVFVRCHRGESVYNWKIERELFLELPDPFVEMPEPFGSMGIFPAGVPWFMHSRDDEPLIYFAGNSELISAIDQACPRRVIRLAADDTYY